MDIPGWGSEAPLTHQAMEEFWDFATTAVACRPEEHIVCVKEFLVLFLGFLEFGLCWRRGIEIGRNLILKIN